MIYFYTPEQLEQMEKEAKLIHYHCGTCGTSFDFDPELEDPTSSAGACCVCGATDWSMSQKGSLI